MNSEYIESLRTRLKAVQTAITTIQSSDDVDSYTIFGSVTVTKGNRQAKLITLKDEEQDLLMRIMLASGITRRTFPFYR